MDSDSDSEFDYESDNEIYMEFDDISNKVDTSNLLEKISKLSETPLMKLGDLISYHEILDKETANRNWDLLVGSYVARAHWRKWGKLWFGKRDKYGRRVVDREKLERGSKAQTRYEIEVSNPYRRRFLNYYLGADIGSRALVYL